MPLGQLSKLEPSAGFEPAPARGRNPALCPLSYEGSCSPPPPRLWRASCFADRTNPAKRAARSRMVRAAGFEPATSWFQARSAAGLRYALKVDHPAGLEPATSRTATGCSRPTELWMDYLAPVAGIEPAYSPLNRRRRAPCSALTGMVENRGNAPRAACLQGEPEPLLVPHPTSRCALRRICIRAGTAKGMPCEALAQEGMAPKDGIEPPARGSSNRRSTAELLRLLFGDRVPGGGVTAARSS